MKRMRNLKGFTLIELIVVILILGILAAIAVVGYTSVTEKARNTALQANARQVVTSLSADATSNESTVAAFLAGPALAGPDGIAGGTHAADDYATVQDYLDAKFPGAGVTGTSAGLTVANSAGSIAIDTSKDIASAGKVVAP